MTTPRTSEDSIRRDAWRIQLFEEQVAAEAAVRRAGERRRQAALVGVILGLLASAFIHF